MLPQLEGPFKAALSWPDPTVEIILAYAFTLNGKAGVFFRSESAKRLRDGGISLHRLEGQTHSHLRVQSDLRNTTRSVGR